MSVYPKAELRSKPRQRLLRLSGLKLVTLSGAVSPSAWIGPRPVFTAIARTAVEAQRDSNSADKIGLIDLGQPNEERNCPPTPGSCQFFRPCKPLAMRMFSNLNVSRMFHAKRDREKYHSILS